MKINYKLVLPILLTLFASCSDDSIKCDGYSEKRTLKEVLKELQLSPEMLVAYKVNRIDDMENYINHFYDDVVEFNLIRTTDINKDIKKCSCSSKMKFNLDSEIKKLMDQKTENNPYQKFIKSTYLGEKGVDVDYSVQETSNGEFIVESYLPDDLNEILLAFYYVEKAYKENIQNSEVIEDKTNADNDSIGGQYEYPNDDKNYDMCFKKVESSDENGQSIIWLQLKENKQSNRIIGDYGYYPHYDMDSWRGKISAKRTQNGIEGSYVYSSEGMEYIEPFILEIKDNKAIYMLSEGVIYIDGEAKESNSKPIILEKTDCK